MKYKLLLTSLLSIAFLCVFSQNISVKGLVLDEKNQPLPGVSISIKGTTTGTVTDFDGKFEFTFAENSELTFSFIGYTPQTIKAQANMQIQLQPETVGLNEIVVVGYGTQRAKDMTAPITTVKNDVITKQTTSNPMSALQGKIAGVQITNNGAPGSGASVKIRGVGSIGDYASPLYVVDGVFVDNIDFLSNSDIEDMSVLKDASASAIYGVRAANGVILITTKKGKGRDMTISYESYVGVQVPVNIMKMTNTGQYVTTYNESLLDPDGYTSYKTGATPLSLSTYKGANTNWYKEILRNAIMHNHSLDVCGGKDKMNYAFGLNYIYQEGIMDAKNDYERFNIRANTDYQASEHIKIGFNVLVSKYTKVNPKNDAFFQAYINPPTYNVYDQTNTVAYPVKFGSPQRVGLPNEYANPVAVAYYNDSKEDGYKIIPSMFLEINILDKKLTYKTQYNQDLTFYNSRNYTPEYFVGGSQGIKQSVLSKTFMEKSKQILDNTLTFKDVFDRKHNVTFMVGHSIRQENSSGLTGSAVDVPGSDEQSKYLVNGSYKDKNTTDEGYKYNGVSFFSRGSYSYEGKYLLTATIRADGSSKYQEKWGYFPSLGIGWILTEENFMKGQNLFQNLKVRASWGMLGNDNVPSNSAQTVGTSGVGASGVFGDKLTDGVGAQTVIRNYLKWEVVNEFDLGVDFSLLKDKLHGDVDIYRRVTDNVVFNAPIASGGGTAELLGNNGSIENMGIEMSLTWGDKINTDFSYSVGGNLTLLHNEVLKVQGRSDGIIYGGYVNGNASTRSVEGKPIGAFYGYEVEGVYATKGDVYRDSKAPAWAQAGYLKYKDVNRDGKIDEKDITYLGSPIPWLMGGVDLSINYKWLDFSLSLQGQYGNKILNAKRMNRRTFPTANYDLDFYENRWTPTSYSSEYPSAEAMGNSNIQTCNSFFVENGAYIRIQNIQLGFNIPKMRIMEVDMPKLRIYGSAQRPLTLFVYNGFSPEVGGEPTSNGIDNTVYPMQAIFTVGIKATF